MPFRVVGRSFAAYGGSYAPDIIYIYYYIYVRTSSCTVTRATRKREAGIRRDPPLQVLSTEQNISRRRNGFLQTLRCYARETGDRTEKTSCQYVDVCQRVRNHLSSLKAREKLAYVQ